MRKHHVVAERDQGQRLNLRGAGFAATRWRGARFGLGFVFAQGFTSGVRGSGHCPASSSVPVRSGRQTWGQTGT